ncbi:hypothetical protein ADILRU_1654 [Leifsonia rubra CMS 76R]|nr:hypothetical protein ADILRU_1654 [Leifsonia rubra CMS 76R]
MSDSRASQSAAQPVPESINDREFLMLPLCFAHRPLSGAEVVLGTAQSTIQWNDNGELEFSETFRKTQ